MPTFNQKFYELTYSRSSSDSPTRCIFKYYPILMKRFLRNPSFTIYDQGCCGQSECFMCISDIEVLDIKPVNDPNINFEINEDHARKILNLHDPKFYHITGYSIDSILFLLKDDVDILYKHKHKSEDIERKYTFDVYYTDIKEIKTLNDQEFPREGLSQRKLSRSLPRKGAKFLFNLIKLRRYDYNFLTEILYKRDERKLKMYEIALPIYSRKIIFRSYDDDILGNYGIKEIPNENKYVQLLDVSENVRGRYLYVILRYLGVLYEFLIPEEVGEGFNFGISIEEFCCVNCVIIRGYTGVSLGVELFEKIKNEVHKSDVPENKVLAEYEREYMKYEGDPSLKDIVIREDGNGETDDNVKFWIEFKSLNGSVDVIVDKSKERYIEDALAYCYYAVKDSWFNNMNRLYINRVEKVRCENELNADFLERMVDCVLGEVLRGRGLGEGWKRRMY